MMDKNSERMEITQILKKAGNGIVMRAKRMLTSYIVKRGSGMRGENQEVISIPLKF